MQKDTAHETTSLSSYRARSSSDKSSIDSAVSPVSSPSSAAPVSTISPITILGYVLPVSKGAEDGNDGQSGLLLLSTSSALAPHQYLWLYLRSSLNVPPNAPAKPFPKRKKTENFQQRSPISSLTPLRKNSRRYQQKPGESQALTSQRWY